MARICDNCGRTPNQAISRSHSNIATKRRQFVNLQVRRIAGKSMRVCTRCIKGMKREMEMAAAK